MKLTVRETARLLSVSERQLYRWMDEGIIPSYRIGNQPRFSRAELLEWAMARRLPLSPELFEAGDNGDPGLHLTEALERGGIHFGVEGATREAILRAAVAGLPALEEQDRNLLLSFLSAQESAGSTEIGEGIAIPEVRRPIVLPGTDGAITLLLLAKPLPLRAVGGQLVHTLFFVLSPTINAHLQLLARLSLALLDPGFKDAVLRRAGKQHVLAEARRVEEGFLREPAGAPTETRE
jgi:PTS system nitrogen regulatory IIA component